jgi:hypothetical protein
MNKSETALFLAKVSVVDNRKTDSAAVQVWHEILEGVPMWAANLALTQFRRENGGKWVEPGHIYPVASSLAAQNRARVRDAKRYQLLSQEWNEDAFMPAGMVVLLNEYQSANARLMANGEPDESAQARFQELRASWDKAYGEYSPKAIAS